MKLYYVIFLCIISLNTWHSWGQNRIDIIPSSLEFSNSSEEKTFSVRTNVDWRITNTPDWLTIHPSSGRGNTLVRVTASANENTTQRKETLFFSSMQIPGLTRVDVTQAASPLSQATWTLTPTMKATLNNGIFTISTSENLDAMPDFVFIGYPSLVSCPWFEFRLNILSSVIDNKITNIGDLAFYSCTNMSSVTIPNSVTSIGNYAFAECQRLISIQIPKSTTFIGNHAFNGCRSLVSIEIPNSVTSIGNYAFHSCINLKSISIPNSVRFIGNYAFSNSSRIIDCTVTWETPLYVADDVFSGVNTILSTLYVPKGTKALYQAVSPWNTFGTIVEYNSTVGTNAVKSQTLNAHASNGILHITGLETGKPFSIYSISGQLIYRGISKDMEEYIPVNVHGIYIVATEYQTIKVVLK